MSWAKTVMVVLFVVVVAMIVLVAGLHCNVYGTCRWSI